MQNAVELIYVSDLVKKTNLNALTENQGEYVSIVDDSVSRPTLELSGNFNYFKSERIQLFGAVEQEMLDELMTRGDQVILEQLLSYQNIPMIVFSRGYKPNDKVLALCDSQGIAVFSSPLTTTMLISKLSQTLREYFAPQIGVHGVMLEVCGSGVLLQGRSSIGKSETALELISRGKSKLVADDRVILYENEPGVLIARSPKILEQMIEIRGIGIVDVISMYGGGIYKASEKLALVIQLIDWDKNFKYNRVGVEVEYIKFLETQVAQIVLPVHTGRNVANLIEAAVLNHQLKELGINSAETFTNRLTEAITGNQELAKEGHKV